MKKHSIRALILIAATVLALASCSGGNKPAGTTDGSKTTTGAPAQSTAGTVEGTKDGGTETSAPVTTEAPKKLGASGLEAVKGTVPTYIDGPQNHINLKEGDQLISVRRVAIGEKVIMVSSAGKAIMWSEGEVRAMGRDTMGVKGMTVPVDAHVLGMEIAKPGSDLFVITEKGYGKRTSIDEYPEHHRGGQGVFTITMTDKKGLLSVMKIVKPNDEIMIISEEGVVVRTPVSGISELGRSTQGVRVMNVADKDRVTAVAISSTGKKKRDQKVEGDDVDDIDEIELVDEGELGEDDLD